MYFIKDAQFYWNNICIADNCPKIKLSVSTDIQIMLIFIAGILATDSSLKYPYIGRITGKMHKSTTTHSPCTANDPQSL